MTSCRRQVKSGHVSRDQKANAAWIADRACMSGRRRGLRLWFGSPITEANACRIVEGMSEEEVIAILGQPGDHRWFIETSKGKEQELRFSIGVISMLNVRTPASKREFQFLNWNGDQA